jgi:alkyl hydroperoxide reductase subunit AhpF
LLSPIETFGPRTNYLTPVSDVLAQTPTYEAVADSGPAGLTTALYATRLGHRTVMADDLRVRVWRVQEADEHAGVTAEQR